MRCLPRDDPVDALRFGLRRFSFLRPTMDVRSAPEAVWRIF
jgi:hypothetical protein